MQLESTFTLLKDFSQRYGEFDSKFSDTLNHIDQCGNVSHFKKVCLAYYSLLTVEQKSTQINFANEDKELLSKLLNQLNDSILDTIATNPDEFMPQLAQFLSAFNNIEASKDAQTTASINQKHR